MRSRRSQSNHGRPGANIDTVAAIPTVQAAAGSKASTVSRVPISPPMSSPERIKIAMRPELPRRKRRGKRLRTA